LDGFSKILLEDHSSSLDTEVKRKLQIISENAKKMGLLIDDLLAFARLGRAEIRFESIAMRSLAESVYDELITHQEKVNIEFRLGQIPDNYGDPSMMRQVFLNLIGNAIKFSSKKPDPVIEVGYRSDKKGNYYYIKDNGAGFDMTYSAKLFGVFQRLHSTGEFEGTGVGLAIVQRIIQRLNGQVWAEGIVDQGATFCFTLPGNQSSLGIRN
jgi:light-regulated signal transduction histidine kinase (bacteriophytochrome)